MKKSVKNQNDADNIETKEIPAFSKMTFSELVKYVNSEAHRRFEQERQQQMKNT